MDRRVFLLSSVAGLTGQSLFAQGDSAGLQLELRQEEKMRDGRPRFEVTFRNKASLPVVLDLGIILGIGAFAGNVQFLLKDSNGRVRLLTKRDPQYVAGWAAPYIVEVPRLGAFYLPSIDLVDYWSHEPEISVLHLPAGLYSLTATFKGRDPNKDFVSTPGQPHIQRWPQTFWMGDLSSKAIEITLSSPV